MLSKSLVHLIALSIIIHSRKCFSVKQTQLDPHGNYHLKWETNNNLENITFEVEVKTHGWVGFGLSPAGGMAGSDIVIAWIDANGKTHFTDRHAQPDAPENMPIIDASQDWHLISSYKNETHSVFRFTRDCVTCDQQNNDVDITFDIMRVIYAYGNDIPASDFYFKKHEHQKRGTKNLILLSNNEENAKAMVDKDVQVLDLVVDKIIIPKKNTTYWCKIVKVSQDKTHAIKYEPVILPGNEAFVHHMSIYSCNHPSTHKLIPYVGQPGHDCTEEANMPEEFSHCFIPYMLWAAGAGEFNLPPEAGFPLGVHETTYLLIQIHYDNPDLVEGVVDSSGLRIFHTKNLRKYDAFSLFMGAVFDYGMLIPPGQKEVKVSGHCDPRCMSQKMPPGGIIGFGAMLHAHYIAKTIKIRHFRGDEELPWMATENNYDFNLQDLKSFRKVINVLPGDQLTTECTFDSSKRKRATLGGLATSDEMCSSVLFYYPKMNNTKPCFSGLTPSTLMSFSGVKEVYEHKPWEIPTIKSPESLRNQSLKKYMQDKNDWNHEFIDKSKDLLFNSQQRPQCYWLKTPSDAELTGSIGYPEVKKTYLPPRHDCYNKIHAAQSSTKKLFIVLLVGFLCVIIALISFICINRKVIHRRFY